MSSPRDLHSPVEGPQTHDAGQAKDLGGCGTFKNWKCDDSTKGRCTATCGVRTFECSSVVSNMDAGTGPMVSILCECALSPMGTILLCDEMVLTTAACTDCEAIFTKGCCRLPL
jgi:hypothetical protein